MNTGNPYEQALDPAALDDGPANPYIGAAAHAPAPDLDATAPSLRQAEQQRVNRKALAFLGGIVVLLVAMAYVVFRGATGNEPPKKNPDESVHIPTLSDANTPPLPPSGMPSNAAPIDVEPTTPQPMPPLPERDAYASVPPPAPGMAPSYAAPAAPRAPTLLERRMGAEGNGGVAYGVPAGAGPQDAYGQALAITQAALGGQKPPAADEAAAPAPRRKVLIPQPLRNPDTLMVRGTYLRCVLETRVVSDVPGYTSCVVTEPVYSVNGHSLLLPRGSKIYGSYDRRATNDRLAVVWDRVITPTGLDVNMSSPGTDNLGGAGHPGQLDSHWGSRIGAALLVSMLSDLFKYEAAEHGPTTSTIVQGAVVQSPFESNTARTIEQIANRAAEEAMSRPPTVTINQGTVVNVYVAQDIDFAQVLGR